MKIIQIPGVKYFGTVPIISVVNFQEESWEKQANALAISPNCFHLWLYITDGRVRAECRMFITNFFEVSFFFYLYFTLEEIFSFTSFLGRNMSSRRKSIHSRKNTYPGYGKMGLTCLLCLICNKDLSMMNAYFCSGVSFSCWTCSIWICNYIFIRSEILSLVIRAFLWNVNPSGACSEQ